MLCGMPLTTRVLSGLGSLGVAAATAVRVADLLDGVGAREADGGPLPGDDRHAAGAVVRTRATTVAAPRDDVWPWIAQLGYGRAGWYSIDALERLVGAARSLAQDGATSWRSLDHVAQRHQDLAVGDEFPLNETLGFEVVELEQPDHLVVVFEHGGLRMVWAYVLRDVGEATRLVVRTAFEADGPLLGAVTRTLLDPGHAVMELVQLRRIKRRAEGYLAAEATTR
jgi:hypothetical protein